jgi:hypothetical protein
MKGCDVARMGYNLLQESSERIHSFFSIVDEKVDAEDPKQGIRDVFFLRGVTV